MNAFLFAWRNADHLPTGVVRAAAGTLAWTAWATRAKPAVRLEENLARVTGLEGRALRRVGRRGMASVARYYAEVLELSRMTEEQVDARVRLDADEPMRALLASEGAKIAVLGHNGNWDLAGAWASRNLIPVTAVAEVLEPREVFDQFVAVREQVGISVLGHEGSSTFRELIRLARGDRRLICLLADRDLSGSGVATRMWGHEVKVAPGPGALAAATGAMLIPVMVRYERLHGEQRRRARARWGVVLSFGPVIDPGDYPGQDRVEAMTRAWTAWLGEQVAHHPEDWHMLQRFGWVA
ncbi:phosphatidylinositol mannoside acyltransferase [Demequina activiva]|uniref:Lipid A biosynthesis lauroyl acyltransferase n=1 Tax=Demequina activiva TaxID=1582364 RepID=A0A919Q527_9MICO|nr:phosphatidylinositol mannoside acyltransferase [Demequina activiva]GIG54653.1 lipid A biosynthesis lauroyl acyltransferase [Demequina activiva]